MAFLKTEPTDQTKIRNLGEVLRANFVAMQEGDSSYAPWALNFIRRDGEAPSDDPTQIADNIILYSKDSAAGKSELYAINEDGNSYQMTSGVPINGVNGESFLPGVANTNKLKWGQFTLAANTETIKYAVTGGFQDLGLNAFPNNTYAVFLTPINSGGIGNFRISTQDANGFTVVSVNGASFFVWAIGD